MNVYMNYSMNKEIAETLEDAGLQKIRDILNSKNVNNEKKTNNNKAMNKAEEEEPPNEELKQDLLMISHMFVEASSYYTQDDCYQKAGRCMALADFISVVLNRMLDVTSTIRECKFMLNGIHSKMNGEKVMAMFSNCQDAIAVAKACDLHTNWQTFMLSLYNQVIQKKNMNYMLELHSMSVSSLPAKAFEQLSEKFKQDTSRAKYFHAFKATMRVFLERIVTNLDDVNVVLHSVAGDLEFNAMGFADLESDTNARLEIGS